MTNTQTDVLDVQFTVSEMMLLAANLKLGNELKVEQKQEVVSLTKKYKCNGIHDIINTPHTD